MSVTARQSTARTIMVGPVLDASGVAVTGAVIGDFKISKNGAAPAGLNASATLTHRHTGHYSLALTATDTDTVGSAQITLDKTTDTCPEKDITVVEEVIYDAIWVAAANTFTGAAGATKLTGLVLADTLTTYTGNTPQTGDCYPKVDTEVATLVTGVADVQSRLPAALTVNGNMKSSLMEIIATALTETSGQLAGGFKKWFNVAAPTGTVNSVPDALPDAPTGLVSTTAFQARTLAAASYATASAVTAIAAIFTGITSLAQWLGLIAGKQAGNSTARTELRATGAGSGTYDETTDSQEALKDLLPASIEAAILNEGDATALLAAIAAKIEEFLINEGDATATIAAIATACNAAITSAHGAGSYIRNTEPDNTTITSLQKLLRADRKIDKTTDPLHWDEVLLEEGTSTELVRRELFDPDGTALAAETTRIGRAIKSP